MLRNQDLKIKCMLIYVYQVYQCLETLWKWLWKIDKWIKCYEACLVFFFLRKYSENEVENISYSFWGWKKSLKTIYSKFTCFDISKEHVGSKSKQVYILIQTYKLMFTVVRLSSLRCYNDWIYAEFNDFCGRTTNVLLF